MHEALFNSCIWASQSLIRFKDLLDPHLPVLFYALGFGLFFITRPLKISVVDPNLEFQVNPDLFWIRIQGFDDQKLKKITAEKRNIFFFYMKFINFCG